MYQESITQQELKDLPLKAFSGKITVIDSMNKLEHAVSQLCHEPILGFDTERKPSFQKGHISQVALLQLSSIDHCYLFRLNKTGLAKELKAILSDARILKVGVAIRDDIHGLQQLSSFSPAGFIELQQKVKEYGIQDNGLKKLAGIVLGMRISKSQQLTNWEADKLTEAQQIYAATDAWVALGIFNSICDMGVTRR